MIATYNMGKYVPLAVRSVLDQTYSNIEVIAIDDGSIDDTRARMQEFVGNPRITYYHQSNKGQPQAKNQGIRLSKGEFIGFCDADDMWAPDKLELQMPCFDLDPEIAVVSSDISVIDPSGRVVAEPNRDRYSGRILEKLLIKNCISFGTAVVRRRCLDDVGWFDESLPMGIDWDLWLRLAAKYKFHHIPRRTYFYRYWEGQMSHDNVGRYQNAFRILDKFFSNHANLVSRQLREKAYADTYVGRGRLKWLHEGRRIQALSDFGTALRHSPTYWPAWKSIIKLLINRRTGREPPKGA